MVNNILNLQKEKPIVVHIVSTYLAMTNSWIYNQIRYLTRWQAIILCNNTKNMDVFPFESVYSLPSQIKLLRLALFFYRKIRGYNNIYFRHKVKTEHAKILHSHFGPVGYDSLSLAQATSVPLVTTFYGYDLSRLPVKQPVWQQRYLKLFEEGQMFLVEGPFMRQQLIRLGCPPYKAHVLHLGVDLTRLPFMPRQINDDGIVRILAAATITEKKGLTYAVEAFGLLAQHHQNVRLTIIGDARAKPTEQALKHRLTELVERYKVEHKVRFLGYQPHDKLIEQFYSHHIFLSPSVQASDGDNEGGSPVTITEASASGMPVVSTTHCDIPEVIKDGKSGYLVKERDVDPLVNSLINLVENPDKWSYMGRFGRTHIEQEFDILQTVYELEEKYNLLMQ
jgi:colanic acid/amylovoran biosynthesis glycosyltransferase